MAQISIIVPVYKAENYICRCIDSLLSQTFEDFELILVDDGSPDSCGAICDDFAARDSRIRVIHKTNGGVSSARNAGMDVASGNYIMFCDSDDYVASDWCRTLHDVIARNPNAFVASNLWKVDNNTRKLYQPNSDSVETTDYFTLYKYGLSAYSCNKIYRTDVIKQHQLRFDEACRFAEDVAFNVSYALFCREYIYVAMPLYYYVNTQGSIMNSYHANLFELHLPVFWCRLPLISSGDLGEYCDMWLYQFLHMFDVVFDKRNTMGFFQKLRFNQRMIRSKEFVYCVEHASGKQENPRVLQLLRTKNYYLLWIFSKILKLKVCLKAR